jgi:phage terminase Nu1 subunit (DNA packaging protein)
VGKNMIGCGGVDRSGIEDALTRAKSQRTQRKGRKEIAAIVGISYRQVTSWARLFGLPVYRRATMYFAFDDELLKWCEENTQALHHVAEAT